MKTKIFTRITTFILALLIVFYAVPGVVYTEAAEAIGNIELGGSKANETENGKKDIYSFVGEAYEDMTLREENVKYFHLEDGSYIAAQYDHPVHLLNEDNRWVDIYNTLISDGSDFGTGDERIKFAKKITGNNSIFTLKDGNTKLTFSFEGATKGIYGAVSNYADAEEDTKLQKMMNLEKLSSRILYENILDGVDL